MSSSARPSAEILSLPLEVRAEMALKEAVEEAIKEHARDELSVAVLRDGKVVEIPAEELLDPYAP
jgi:hypothetical protein